MLIDILIFKYTKLLESSMENSDCEESYVTLLKMIIEDLERFRYLPDTYYAILGAEFDEGVIYG